MVTVVIMEPPVWYGGSTSRSSCLPYSTPMPVGPSILWPENTAKSTSSCLTSRDRCGADWHASSTTRAPARRAMATSSLTGLMVPSTLDAWVNASSRVRSPTISAAWSMRSDPESSIGMCRSVAPVR